MLLMGLVLVTLFPSLLPPAPESSKEVLRDMGFGFVALVTTPLLMVIVALTVIGIPVSMLIGVVYALLVFLSTLVVAYFAAQRLPAGDSRRRLVLNTWASLLVILFVLAIPFVGAGLSFFVHIFGLGCLVLHLKNLYTQSRGSRTRRRVSLEAGDLVNGSERFASTVRQNSTTDRSIISSFPPLGAVTSTMSSRSQRWAGSSVKRGCQIIVMACSGMSRGAGRERQGRRGGTPAEARGGGEDEVALGDDFEGGGELGDSEGDAAFETSCVQDAVDEAGTLASR